MKQPLSTLPKLALAISAIAVAAPAISQSVLEEIVVVAQKREQNLQDVPIAISAFTGEQYHVDELHVFLVFRWCVDASNL